MSSAERIKELLKFQLGKVDIKLDDDLASEHGADSLDFVEINLAVEEEFEIDLRGSEDVKIQTARDILNLVETILEKGYYPPNSKGK